MKPDWKDAPEWANWLAMDMSGKWHWWESEPDFNGEEWLDGGMCEPASGIDDAWDILEARP